MGLPLAMKKLRPILTALVALLFYTVTDILIWQRIFEANQMVEYADMYHTGWFVTLAGYALLGTILMWGAWNCLFFLITLFIGAFSGLEDVLYYVLDGKPMPEALPWLSGNPLIYGESRAALIGSVLFWIAALFLLYFVLYIKRSNREKITE